MTQMEHVEGGIALSCESAPFGNGKQFGKALHADKKMILPDAYGLLCGVCAMDVQWSVLNASLFSGNKHFDFFGCFVVEFMQERFEAVESKPGIDLTIGMQKLFFRAILVGNRANCVGVEDVEDSNICIAAVGHGGEAVGLIGEEVAIDLVDGHENKMWSLTISGTQTGSVLRLGTLSWVDWTPWQF